MNPDPVQAAIGAGVAAVVTVVAVWLARKIGTWFLKAVSQSFAEQVVEVMAPDMARLGTRLGSSIDELRDANATDHAEVQRRLGDVEARLHDVESRLVDFQTRLPGRPPHVRTRVTDRGEL